MRPELLYLADIIEAADAIARYLAALTGEEDFYEDDLRQSAILQKLIVIGEAASHLSAPFRERFVDVEWADIVAFRNIAVHAYFSVKWEIVWVTATQDVPRLCQRVVEILADVQDE